MLDLAGAVAHNARYLGTQALPKRTQERLVVLLADFQADAGLEPTGRYDRAAEAALNDRLARLVGPHAVVAAAAPPPATVLPGGDGFTSAEVIARARAMVELCAAQPQKYQYRLGGGAPYTEASAFATDHTCDCTGLVAWCAGYRRGRYNTDAIVDDVWRRHGGRITAQPGPRRLWGPVAADDVRPADVIVFAGKDENGDGAREAPGHAGVVTWAKPGAVFGAGDWPEELRVVHCRWRVRAARETTAAVFDLDRTIIVRCRLVRY